MATELSRDDAERRNDPSRVIAFTDGVFAIIITILVLDIRVPSNLSEQSLREALDEIGPTLVTWVISFLLVGMYWVWHRDVFDRVRSVNRDLVWLNLLFLLPVSLVPFAASVLGEYHDQAVALVLYGVVLVVVSLARMAVFAYVIRRSFLLWQPVPDTTRRIALVVAHDRRLSDCHGGRCGGTRREPRHLLRGSCHVLRGDHGPPGPTRDGGRRRRFHVM